MIQSYFHWAVIIIINIVLDTKVIGSMSSTVNPIIFSSFKFSEFVVCNILMSINFRKRA